MMVDRLESTWSWLEARPRLYRVLHGVWSLLGVLATTGAILLVFAAGGAFFGLLLGLAVVTFLGNDLAAEPVPGMFVRVVQLCAFVGACAACFYLLRRFNVWGSGSQETSLDVQDVVGQAIASHGLGRQVLSLRVDPLGRRSRGIRTEQVIPLDPAARDARNVDDLVVVMAGLVRRQRSDTSFAWEQPGPGLAVARELAASLQVRSVVNDEDAISLTAAAQRARDLLEQVSEVDRQRLEDELAETGHVRGMRFRELLGLESVAPGEEQVDFDEVVATEKPEQRAGAESEDVVDRDEESESLRSEVFS